MLGNPMVERMNGETQTVADILADTHTDAFLVLSHGRIVAERYFGTMTDSTRHLIMSVSKSIVGCVAGLLVERRQLDPNAQVTDYVPEVAGAGYGGATVRDVLDMRTGVAFSEAYTSEDAGVRVMERSMGWRPPLAEDPRGAYDFLAALDSEGPHGGQFVYRSADTDMLGWICERSAGLRMADLISQLIWQPIGTEFDAEITCDSSGTAIHDGGISTTLRDLGRFGQMVLDDGVAFGRRVVPAAWFADCLQPRIRRPRGVRQHRQRADAARRVVSKSVLVPPDPARADPVVPRHPRPADLRRPRDTHCRGEALVVAGRAEPRAPRRHVAGLQRVGYRSRRLIPGSPVVPAITSSRTHPGCRA